MLRLSPWTGATGGGAKGAKARGIKPTAAALRVELVPELPAVIKSRRQALDGCDLLYDLLYDLLLD